MKQLFEDLRTHERASAPQFDAVLQRRRPPRRLYRSLLVAVSAAAAIVLLLIEPRHIRDDVATQSITQWRAPTDALLPQSYKSVLSFEDLP